MPAKRFDPDRALDAALQVFWSRGYERATAEHLVQAMGINRGSWYATFGGKSELYRLALARYCQDDLDSWRRELTRPEPLVDVLRSVLHRSAAALATDPNRRGCMLANAAAELRPGAQGFEQVANALDDLHELLARALQAAQARAELPAQADPQALAGLLVTAIQGLRVTGKVNPDPSRQAATIEAALASLYAPPPPRNSQLPSAGTPVPTKEGSDG